MSSLFSYNLLSWISHLHKQKQKPSVKNFAHAPHPGNTPGYDFKKGGGGVGVEIGWLEVGFLGLETWARNVYLFKITSFTTHFLEEQRFPSF